MSNLRPSNTEGYQLVSGQQNIYLKQAGPEACAVTILQYALP